MAEKKLEEKTPSFAVTDAEKAMQSAAILAKRVLSVPKKSAETPLGKKIARRKRTA